MQDYELLTMILSALMWRKNNGPISLYGDKRAIAYVEEKGISHIWNGGLYDISVPDSVRANVFWASGKLYALKEVKAPSVMVDLDLIVWKSVHKHGDKCSEHYLCGECGFKFPDDELGKNRRDHHQHQPGDTILVYLKDRKLVVGSVAQAHEFQ